MKTAVIVAAGMGTRLKDRTKKMPKGFLEIDSVSLIERSIMKLMDAGIEKIVIGTGYLSEHFERLQDFYPVVCIKSDRYETTSSMYTLHNMKDEIDGDFILLESDLLFDRTGLNILLEDNAPDVVLSSGFTQSNDEVFIEADNAGNLVKMSKDRNDLNHLSGELVGITKISKPFFDQMCVLAENIFKTNPKIDYEYVLVETAKKIPMKVNIVSDYTWCEIDDESHLNRALTQIYPELIRKEAGVRRVKRNILLNPGPATTSDTVKYAMVVPDICPREFDFAELVRDVQKDAVKVVHGGDEYTSVFFAGSGTAVMDSVISSVVPPKGRLLVIVNGAYGDRLVKIAQAYKIDCLKLDFGHGGIIDVAKVEETIKSEGNIDTVSVICHETTTGILNPVKEIGALKEKYNFSYVVDAISAYASIPINIKEFNVDYLLSTSNKGIHGMAGLAFSICRIEALEAIKDFPVRSFYLNLYNQYKNFAVKGEWQFTPPVQIMYALRQAMKEYFEEGEMGRYHRYTACWRVYRDELPKLGFKFLHEEGIESHILTTIIEPEIAGYSFKKMHDYLYERGFTIYPGKIGHANTFRLSNIGDVYPEDIKKFIKYLKQYMIDELGGVPA